MKIFKIINDNFNSNINKTASDWDDIVSIPDIADTFTEEEYEIKNPLCYDFWSSRIHMWQFNSNFKSSLYASDMYTNINFVKSDRSN